MAAALETAINRGRLNMKQIRELKEASIDFNESMISKKVARKLAQENVDEIFSSGTLGSLTRRKSMRKIPIDLNINAKKAKGVVHELARSRLSNSPIRVVALLRRRNQQGVPCLRAIDMGGARGARRFVHHLHEKITQSTVKKSCRLQMSAWGISDSSATLLLGETKDSVFSVGAEEEKFVF
ncbi:hypothetical protein OIU84_026897 [Salix udensis]|uniref:Uncharacterized protein n=1 Tax=Salix udensis TaxID=889485 RepID=A0AAD6KE31_9ROSI|nr:hypothetical protein OIU84_026897 [Salix udensis]